MRPGVYSTAIVSAPRLRPGPAHFTFLGCQAAQKSPANGGTNAGLNPQRNRYLVSAGNRQRRGHKLGLSPILRKPWNRAGIDVKTEKRQNIDAPKIA